MGNLEDHAYQVCCRVGVVLAGGGGRSHLDHQNCGCSGRKGCNQVIWLIGGSGVTFNRNENFIMRP